MLREIWTMVVNVLRLLQLEIMLREIWTKMVNVLRLLQLLFEVRMHSISKTGKHWSIVDLFEKQVDRDPGREQFVQAENGEKMTLGELDSLANQCAHWGMSVGLHLSNKDTVALMLVNSPAYVAFWYGMAKIGVVTALINTGSVGLALMHSVETALRDNEGIKLLVISRELYTALPSTVEDEFEQLGIQVMIWEELYTPGLESYGDVVREIGIISTANKTRPSKSVRAHVRESDVLLYIYTSGTTGLPKASKITHTRYYVASSPFRILCALSRQDRVYCPLPLYHSSAVMLGVGGAIISGATMVLRKKFSVRAFSKDCLDHRITAVQYIGELCRYLKDAAAEEADALLDIRIAFGNGLRADVWEGFRRRYGIRHVVEFYAATESNIATFGLDKVGACGFVPRFANFIYPVKIVRTDSSNPGVPLRNPETGWCTLCGPGEPGLVLGEINNRRSDRRFDGYTDSGATESKVVKDVFRKGDAYFNTSDVLYQTAAGYFYFADRTGDTYRWKGENVSASEVENALMLMECVTDAAVFGVDVPGYDGKAGMAVVVLSEQQQQPPQGEGRGDAEGRVFTSEEWDSFRSCCRSHLPPTARPVFLRFVGEIPKTETFKHKKTGLKEDGYDPRNTQVYLCVRKGQENPCPAPSLVDAALHATINMGRGDLI